MATFLVSRTEQLPPSVCWRRLTDWPRHGDRVPLTRVSVAKGSGTSIGDVVLARTALGPWGFDDPMEIVALTTPTTGEDGVCRMEKRGRIVRGWAELRVRADEAARRGTEVVWTEEIRIRGLPAAADALTSRVARFVFGRVLDGLLAPEGPR